MAHQYRDIGRWGDQFRMCTGNGGQNNGNAGREQTNAGKWGRRLVVVGFLVSEVARSRRRRQHHRLKGRSSTTDGFSTSSHRLRPGKASRPNLASAIGRVNIP